MHFFWIESPVNSILAVSEVNERDTIRLLTAEYTDEFPLIGCNRTVENAGDARNRIPSDDRVLCIAPYRLIDSSGRFILPRNIRQRICEKLIFSHISSLLFLLHLIFLPEKS